MVARTRTTIQEELADEPIDVVDAAMDAAEGDKTPFDEIRNFFVNLSETEGDSPLGITLMVRSNPNSNVWSMINTTRPDLSTFDPEKAMDDVLQEHGPGSYKFVVRIGRRIRKHVEFNVGDPRKKNDPVIIAKDDSKEFMPMIFRMMQDNSSQALAAQRESSERFMMMMQQMSSNEKNTITALLPMMLDKKGPDVISLITACAPFIPALIAVFKPKDSMSDIIGIIKSVKDITGDNVGGGEDSGFLGVAKTFAGPLMQALSAQQEQAKLAQMQAAALPAPSHAPSATAQPGVISASNTQGVNKADMHPILALIKDDIEYMASKKWEPTISAETLAANIELQGITYEQVVSMAQEFMVSPDWIEELNKRGIDLREYRVWAQQVLQELINVLAANADNTSNDRAFESGDGRDTSDPAINVVVS